MIRRLLLIWLFILSSAFYVRAQENEDIQKSINEVYKRSKYEIELKPVFNITLVEPPPGPVGPQLPPGNPPQKNDDTVKKPQQPTAHSRQEGSVLPSSPLYVIVLLLISVIAVLVITLGVLLSLKFISLKELVAEETAEEGMGQTDEITFKTNAVLAKAEELISQGKLAEAIHILLSTVVDDICMNIDTRVTYAQTSREIIRKARLNTNMRDAFASLAGSAEKVIFGKLEPDLTLMQGCIANYKSFYQRQYVGDRAL